MSEPIWMEELGMYLDSDTGDIVEDYEYDEEDFD